MAKDIEKLVGNYRAGRSEIGEVYLIETIDHCSSCHSQTPKLKASLNTERLKTEIAENGVGASMAARMLIAIRSFDEAIKRWEEELTSGSVDYRDPRFEQHLLEYLYQAIHLQRPSKETVSLLQSIQESEGLPYFLYRKIDVWKQQIVLLEKGRTRVKAPSDIDRINTDCRGAEGFGVRETYPVCNMLVSALASSLLKSGSGGDPGDDGKLMLYVGTARMNMGMSVSFLPHVERYFEAAILASPDTDSARAAYAYLEEIAFFLYGDIGVAEEIMGVSLEGLRDIADIQ